MIVYSSPASPRSLQAGAVALQGRFQRFQGKGGPIGGPWGDYGAVGVVVYVKTRVPTKS